MGGCTQRRRRQARGALGRGAGTGDAEKRCRKGKAAGQDGRVGGCLRLDDGSSVSPFEIQRTDAAYGLALLLREIGEKVEVFSFSDSLVEMPARRGFALRDAIDASQRHNSTQLGKAVTELNQKHDYDRLIVITDEQAHDTVPKPNGRGYAINVASYRNGMGYGEWTHIDGWSEAIVEYIRALEQTE